MSTRARKRKAESGIPVMFTRARKRKAESGIPVMSTRARKRKAESGIPVMSTRARKRKAESGIPVMSTRARKRKAESGIPVMSTRARKRKAESGNPGRSKSDSDLLKIIKDPIHGNIEVSDLCRKIIDTPQFQRLRYLKQLGGCYFVYPGAAHNRFEHSIGTYYLAGKFARNLRKKHPEQLKEDEIECIEIAGLCHDLGHGPFSHVFDNRFIPRVKPGRQWKHEEASVKMLDYLLEDNKDVKEAFDDIDEDGSRLQLIKDIILGVIPTKPVKDEKKREKRFLYEIVSNDKTGIDVDKWDYFARDCHMLGTNSNFDHDRYMRMARIIDVDGEGLRICPRDKEANNLYDMFHTRMMLHRRACQHTVTIAVELMIVDALQAVNDIVWIPGRDDKGKPTHRKISDCIDDMVAYSKLNDSILQVVEYPITLGTSHQDTEAQKKKCRGKLEKARGILKRIRSRDLYKYVGKRILPPGEKLDIEKTKKEIIKKGKKLFNAKHFEIAEMSFDYGKKTQDPISNVRFYEKSNREKVIPLHPLPRPISEMLPRNFEERAVAIYSKEKEFEKAIALSFRRRWPDAEILKKYEDETTAPQG